MGVNKSLKISVIAAMTFLLAVLISTPGNAGLWEWIIGEQDSLIPIHDPAASPDAEKVEPVVTPEKAATPIISNKLVENSSKLVDNMITRPLNMVTPEAFKPTGEGQTRYVTKWVRVPTTRYFPQLERHETSGLTHVVMKPCTTSSWQLRRVPVTSYRPTLPQILPTFPQVLPTFPQVLRPCDKNAPLLGRILNPLLAPGCGGCIIPQLGTDKPTPAKAAAEAEHQRPSLDPGTLVPDSETEGGVEIRNRPVDKEKDGGDKGEEEAGAESNAPDEKPSEKDTPADEQPAAEEEAASEESSSVLEQPAIEPPEEKKVPGQKEPVKEEDAKNPEKEAAAPYKLQPIPDANRLPRINPAKAPRVLDPRDKTAATPIAVPRLSPVSVATEVTSAVRVTAVVPVTGTIRKLDDSGWVRREK